MKALADERRRQILRVLWDADGAVSLADLADEIARRARASADDVPPDAVRVKTALYHVHLPKLVDVDLVVVAESDEWTRLTFAGTPAMKDHLSDLLAVEEP